jgi:uncharacterized protein (TIGR02246 family)
MRHIGFGSQVGDTFRIDTMNCSIQLACDSLVVLVLVCAPVAAQQDQPVVQRLPTSPAAASAPIESTPPQLTPDLRDLHQGADEFVRAFNSADAKAVAACWTEDGEYVDELGQSYSGRAAIEKEYERFFKEHAGTKMQIVIDSLRLLSDSAAIENGHAVLVSPSGGESPISRYSAVHVKKDGKWLMASVQDAPAEALSDRRALHDLQWLIGTWAAEEHGAKMEVAYRWVADKTYMERTYSVTHPDQSITSGVQIIGWNPQLGRIQSWIFTSDGGHAQGIWTPLRNGWATETVGMMADGTNTSSINLISRLDENAIVSQSVQRTVGQFLLPDTDEVVLKRKPLTQ